jgi:polysaccharide export outer membrane protein
VSVPMSAKRRYRIILLSAFFVAAGFFFFLFGFLNHCDAQTIQTQQLTPQQTEAAKKLTPDQQRAIQEELAKTGGVLTPEAISALKMRPELKDLTPEDVLKGKELLEQREKGLGKAEPALKPEMVPDLGKKAVAEEVKEKTLFDRARQIGKYQDISLDLKPFGYDFFKKAAVQITPEKRDIPVPLNYVIGPGDEIRLLLWGRVNAQYSLTVDRDGKITIPQVGPLLVAGLTFEQMSKFLIAKAEQIVGTNIDITVGSVRTIPVFVLGDVQRPGSYTIGALSTITDALLLAGGPSDIGSMRKVQLNRKDKVITTLDLYDLFLKGDKSRDMVLQAGDVVFVPVTGPLVGIAGNVRRPAIYEFKDSFDLQHLMDLAGGIIPSAYTQQIQVERIVKNEKQVVIDINDKTLEKAKQFMLQDSDLVKVFAIVEKDEDAVYLSGNVKYPGKYALKSGMKMKNLIRDPEDLLKETYFDYALIKRMNPPGLETVLIPFNLGKLLFQDDSSNNLELRPRDRVFVFTKWFFKEKPFVTIEGEIRGDCNLEKKGETERKLEKGENTGKLEKNTEILIAAKMQGIEDSLKKEEDYYLLSKVRDLRQELNNGRITTGEIQKLQSEMEGLGRFDLSEKVREIQDVFRITCRMELSGNMRIKDAILNSGGLTNNAYLDRGEIVRVNSKREYTTLYFSIAKAIQDDPRENLMLQDEDRIIIHSIWEQVYKKSVSVYGDVAKPGFYQYTEKMTVRNLIFTAGNILESAYLEDAEITSLPVESGKIGKVVQRNINLKKALEGDPANNVTLMPYDRLLVKRIPEWREVKYASVSGQIKFPGTYSVQKGEKLSSLIERAGGYTDKAYLRGAYFKRESVRKLQQKSLEEMTQRMERELLAGGAIQVSTAVSQEEIAAKKIELEQKKRLLDTMRKLKATGRMSVALTHLRLLKGSEYDLELEEGDSLFIPEKNSVVNVVGAVMAPGSHIFSEKKSYENYIDESGGYSQYADPDNAFVLKVSGNARKLSQGFIGWSSSRARWEVAGFGEEIKTLEPGDVIVVPEKIERIAWLREIRDITQILMNTAVVAGITIKLF